MGSSYLPLCAVAMLVLVLVQAAAAMTAGEMAAAANCDRQDLSSACKPAVVTGDPDEHCCAKLTEHQPCLCEYFKDPVVWNFVHTEKGKHIFQVCKVAFPSCPPPPLH